MHDINLGLYFVSELVGTAMLLLLGGGVVANVILAKSKGFGGGTLMINWGWGLAVFAGVLVSSYSGAQLNPAVSIALLIVQTSVLDKYLADLAGNASVLKMISWLTLVGIIYITMCILYKYGPSLEDKFRFFSPGAFLATFLFVGVSYLFFYIANHFINYNRVYGSIGTLLMFMAWMFITGMVILIGFELNLSIMMHHKLVAEARNKALKEPEQSSGG